MQDFYKEAQNHYRLGQQKEALELYQKGISDGDEKCWYGYAICLADDVCADENNSEVMKIIAEHFKAIKALADTGDVQAMKIVACCHLYNLIEDASAETYWRYMITSAKQGDSEAQYLIGRDYQFGFFIEQNVEEAVKWYMLSAEQGDPEAQLWLQYLYEQGKEI